MPLKGWAHSLLAALAMLTLAGAVYFHVKWEWIYLLLTIAAGAVIVWKKDAQPFTKATLFLLAPLSVKTELGAGMSLVAPLEPLAVLMAVVLAVQIVFETNAFEKGLTLLKRHPWPALWLLSFIPGLVFSTMPSVSVKYLILNTLYVIVFYYGTLFWRPKLSVHLSRFGIVFLGVTGYALVVFAGYDFNPTTVRGIFEPFFYSHTYYGAVAALLGGWALGQIVRDRRWWIVFVLAFALVLFSTSRAALWSLLFAAVLYGLLGWRPVLRVALPLVAVVLVLIAVGPGAIGEAFEQNTFESDNPEGDLIEESMSVTNVQTDVSNKERLNRWVAALGMFEERPWTGFGPGTYQFTYIPYQDEKLMNRLTVRNPENVPEGSGGTAHSELLLQLSENGMGSVLLFLWMLVRWAWLGFFKVQNRKEAVVPLFIALSTFYFHLNFNNFLNQPAFALLFWALAATLEKQANTSTTQRT